MINIKIAPQPTDCSCGPTTLQAMYTHLGLEISIEQLISEVECVDNGGTLAVLLGIDAIKRGFSDKPVLTGLSATWLNKCKREYTGPQGYSVYDDVQGGPLGHFVILYGIDENLQVSVADPDLNNDIVGKAISVIFSSTVILYLSV